MVFLVSEYLHRGSYIVSELRYRLAISRNHMSCLVARLAFHFHRRGGRAHSHVIVPRRRSSSEAGKIMPAYAPALGCASQLPTCIPSRIRSHHTPVSQPAVRTLHPIPLAIPNNRVFPANTSQPISQTISVRRQPRIPSAPQR